MRSKQRTQHAARQHHHTQAGRGSPGLATTPRSPQDRRNLEYDQLVRTALLRAGGQSFTVEFSGGLRELPGLGTRGPPGPPALGGRGRARRSDQTPLAPPTQLSRDPTAAGTWPDTRGPLGAEPGHTDRPKPFPRRGTSPRAPPTQPSLLRDPRTPRAGSQPAGHLAGGPCHAAPKAQTRTPLGSGRRPGHEQGAAEGPGP